MPRRRSAQLVVIYWRDIPSHVNGVSGAEKHQFPLKPRFEKAIDRAAMKAGLTEASDYVAEWRRESRPAGADITAEAEALAQDLDEKFPLAVLETYINNSGFAPEGEQQ
jgi:hypothetical protein